MLVLSRKTQERIRINEDITIVVLRIAGKRVQLGIEAPSEYRVIRSELPQNDEPQPVAKVA